MKRNYEITGKNEQLIIDADFSVVECLLNDDHKWGAHVIEQAGEMDWKVKYVQLQSRAFYPSIVFPVNENQFSIFSIIGRHQFLAYRIDRLDTTRIQVVPIGQIPNRVKAISAASLAMMFIIPIVLSPLVWKIYEQTTLRNSKLYLDAFCRYLVKELG